jgi:diacylglycerol kinase (ATP)
MKPQLLFIINPVAGHKKAPLIQKSIPLYGLNNIYHIETVLTEYRGHAGVLSARAARENFHAVIAVGGDGTVNESACPLIGTSTALGIIPAGSGNGLARHLHLPADAKAACQKIKQGTITNIDVMEINGRISLNVSGFGFDGYVAWLFDQSKKRGIGGYTRIALKEYFNYKSVGFTLAVDDKVIDRTAHMVVIANASQFGNAAVIAPYADLKDGLMDVIVVRKPALYKLPALFYRLFSGKLKSDQITTMYQCSRLEVSAVNSLHLHIDGEPLEPVSKIQCIIKPLSLKILA